MAGGCGVAEGCIYGRIVAENRGDHRSNGQRITVKALRNSNLDPLMHIKASREGVYVRTDNCEKLACVTCL